MTSVDLRCPQCGAKLRGSESWCSLCHADLRPQPVIEPAPVAEPVAMTEPAAGPDPLTASVEELLEPQGRHARPRDPDGEQGEPLADPEVMLAMLRADSRDPVLSKVGGRMDDPTARFLVMIGGTVVLAGVLFGVYALLGLLVG